MKIYIGASRPIKTLPLSSIIMLYSRKDFSHVYIKYQDKFTGQWMISESSKGEHHEMVVDNWSKYNQIQKEFVIEVTELQGKAILTKLKSLNQTSYSEMNLLGIPFYDAYIKTEIKIFLYLSDFFVDEKGSVICSETTSYALEVIGINFSRPNDFIRPDQIITKLEKLEKTEEYITRSI